MKIISPDTKGLQTRLAEACGVDPSTISYILSRKRRPSIELAEKLEKATGVPWTAWVRPDQYRNPYLPAD